MVSASSYSKHKYGIFRSSKYFLFKSAGEQADITYDLIVCGPPLMISFDSYFVLGGVKFFCFS